MTDYSTIGKTFIDHKEAVRTIACLEKQIDDASAAMQEVAQFLREAPRDVHVEDGVFRLPDESNRYIIPDEPPTKTIPFRQFDPEYLRCILQAYVRASDERDRLAGQLERMG